MYTSGRTVKTSKPRTTTTRASATRDARRLIDRYLPGIAGVTVDSTGTADPYTLAEQVRTVITWPGRCTAAHVQLGAAITELPGYVRATNDDTSITYWRAV